jgi:glutamyl-tRNA reductase
MLQRLQRPLVIIDIAVPRDVEPETAQIDNVFLYDIDALTAIATANKKERQGEIEKATAIVADELEKFSLWWQTLDVRPTVSALVKKAEAIRRMQLEKTLKKLPELSEEERARIDALTKSIVKKLLHHPISHLKNNNGDHGQYIQAVHEIFDLEERDKD